MAAGQAGARQPQSRQTAATGRRKAAPRPRLRVIDQRRLKQATRRRRALVGLASIVVLGMFVSALAQAQLVRGQQELNDMRAEVGEANAEKARLEREIVLASAPHVVVERAQALGMVRATEPRYFAAVRSVEQP